MFLTDSFPMFPVFLNLFPVSLIFFLVINWRWSEFLWLYNIFLLSLSTHTHTHTHARTQTHTHARTHARTHTHTHFFVDISLNSSYYKWHVFGSSQKIYVDTCLLWSAVMVNVLKIEHFMPCVFGLNFAFYAVFLKLFSGMANNVDPDQTAPFALFAYAILWGTLVF